MPPTRHLEFIHSPLHTVKAAQSIPTHGVAIRAAIFRTIDENPHLLVLQRASTDSMPNRWEFPGGGVDDQDGSIKDALYREIREETGLTATWIVQEVGNGQRWQNRRNEECLCITFVVEVEEVELMERSIHAITNAAPTGDEGGDATRKFPDSHRVETQAIPASTTTTTTRQDELASVPVKLSAAEHQRYLWLSEDEIRERCGGGRERLEFTSEDTRECMLQAFAVQKEVIAARKTI